MKHSTKQNKPTSFLTISSDYAAKKASDIQCKGGRIEEEEAYDIVQDIATATAKVVAIGYSECKVTTGKGKVCAFQDVDISSIAHAAAYAFAEGWCGTTHLFVV